MDEQQEKKEDEQKVQEVATLPKAEGDKSKGSDLIAQTNKAAERLAEQNERFEKNLKRQEDNYARMKLGGETGISPAEKPEVITDKDYAEKVLKGEVDPLKDDGFK